MMSSTSLSATESEVARPGSSVLGCLRLHLGSEFQSHRTELLFSLARHLVPSVLFVRFKLRYRTKRSLILCLETHLIERGTARQVHQSLQNNGFKRSRRCWLSPMGSSAREVFSILLMTHRNTKTLCYPPITN